MSKSINLLVSTLMFLAGSANSGLMAVENEPTSTSLRSFPVQPSFRPPIVGKWRRSDSPRCRCYLHHGNSGIAVFTPDGRYFFYREDQFGLTEYGRYKWENIDGSNTGIVRLDSNNQRKRVMFVRVVGNQAIVQIGHHLETWNREWPGPPQLVCVEIRLGSGFNEYKSYYIDGRRFECRKGRIRNHTRTYRNGQTKMVLTYDSQLGPGQRMITEHIGSGNYEFRRTGSQTYLVKLD